jgi:hypothetical protein
MSGIQAAIEAGDLAAALDLLADDVVLRSPVSPTPYTGKPVAAEVVRRAFQIFEGFHYVREIVSADGRDQALIFEAEVSGIASTGCDFVHLNDEGKVDELMVMIRPLPAARALAAAMDGGEETS